MKRLRIKQIVLFVWLMLFSIVPVLAQSNSSFVLLLSSDSEPYLDVVAGIKSVLSQSMSASELRIVVLDPNAGPQLEQTGKVELVVAVGTSATEYALQKLPDTPVFSTFVTRSSLLSVITRNNLGEPEYPKRLRGALVLDQPARRMIELAQLIAPQAQRLGAVVNGSASNNRLKEFQEAIVDHQLRLSVAELFDDSNPIRDLKRIFTESDVFLVIPDASAFNSKVAKWILFLSYRHRIPVIGYSEKYTDAGAAISLFTNPFDIGLDTGEQLRDLIAGRRPASQAGIIRYPRYFSLSINDTVIDSLGIKLGSKSLLKQRLLQKENIQRGEQDE